jgi:hypothetical protein
MRTMLFERKEAIKLVLSSGRMLYKDYDPGSHGIGGWMCPPRIGLDDM